MKKFHERTCLCCGEVFSPRAGNQKYCSVCIPIVNGCRSRRTEQKPLAMARQKIERMKHPGFVQGCEGCKYWRPVDLSVYGCHYLFDTSAKRPCKPGVGCTVRENAVLTRYHTKSRHHGPGITIYK